VSTLDGEETGMAILSRDGLLLYRSKASDMGGLFTISAQGQTFDMPQTITLAGSTERVSR